jgi:DNA polymerase III alpha subunit
MASRRDFLSKTTLASLAAALPMSASFSQTPERNAMLASSTEHLRRLCQAKLSERYEPACVAHASERLNHELQVLDRLGRVDEFLAVGELAQFAREEGIPFRLMGSGCSSIVAFLSGYSDVDPLRHQLPFERFRDPGGRWNPPFVIQTDAEHQGRISHLASSRYGNGFAEQSITFTSATPLERVPRLVVESLRREHGCPVDLARVPLDDDQAYDLIQRGDTDGISLLDLDEIRHLLARLRPVNIGDLAVAVTFCSLGIDHGDLLEAYFRPTGGVEFRRSEHADILESLAETRGLILYQEQIMTLLDTIGGIAPADGFDFIKAALKKRTVAVGEYRATFLRNAENKIDQQTAGRLFDRITEAAGYAACKAACVAAAMAIYQAAYLKAHYRPQFDGVLNTIRSRT